MLTPSASSAADYRIRLHVFEGPMDLLLYLARRAEVDLADIPIAEIAGQYLEYIRHLQRVDIELAGEFLVMAATLLEIKSRLVGPKPERESEGESAEERSRSREPEDPRASLIAALLEYRKFRDLGALLERRRAQWHLRWPAARALRARVDRPQDDEPDLGALLEDLELIDLAQAFARVAGAVDFGRLGDHRVVDDQTPIELYAAEVLDLLARAPEDGEASDPREPGADEAAASDAPAGARRGVWLTELLSGRSRGECIGLFLATLELARQQRIVVMADPAGGGIRLALRPAES